MITSKVFFFGKSFTKILKTRQVRNINHVGKIESWVVWVYDFINSVKYTELVNLYDSLRWAIGFEQLYYGFRSYVRGGFVFCIKVKPGWADSVPLQLFVVLCFWPPSCGSFSCAPSGDPFFWKPDHRSYKDEAQSGLGVDVWRGGAECTLDWICVHTLHIGIWGPLGSGTLCRLNLC